MRTKFSTSYTAVLSIVVIQHLRRTGRSQLLLGDLLKQGHSHPVRGPRCDFYVFTAPGNLDLDCSRAALRRAGSLLLRTRVLAPRQRVLIHQICNTFSTIPISCCALADQSVCQWRPTRLKRAWPHCHTLYWDVHYLVPRDEGVGRGVGDGRTAVSSSLS